MQSEKIDLLTLALIKAQSAMGAVKKDATNPFFKSKYADLASVQGVAEKPLEDNGHVITQGCGLSAFGNFVYTQLTHVSGQWMRSEVPMILAKQDPQGVGSAITYARRYGMAAMLNMVQEDDDGNAAIDSRELPHENGAKPNAVSTQKAGEKRANQIKEYHEANLIKQSEIMDALKKYKAASVKDLPKDVADQLINLGLDRETLANDEKGK